VRLATALPLRATLLAASLAMAVVVTPIAIAAQDADVDERGVALVETFIDILKQPEAEKQAGLEDFLADEFQIVRSNGTTRDKAAYVADPATVFEVSIADVQATEAGGVLVVSYVLSVDEVLDGVETVTVAPRLSVFHQGDDGDWQIAAHANFGALDTAEVEG
jgi:hypothetical protein